MIRRWPVWAPTVLACLTVDAPAQALDPATATEVKAAFLYNFAKFAEWPAIPPSRALTLCVAGATKVGDALAHTVRDKQLDGHSVAAVDVTLDAPLPPCNVLFVAADELSHASALLTTLRATPVLTVSDASGFARAAGIVEIFVERDRLRFAINTDAASRAGIHLSSHLLSLARIVRDAP